jgi:hypothetical protein
MESVNGFLQAHHNLMSRSYSGWMTDDKTQERENRKKEKDEEVVT